MRVCSLLLSLQKAKWPHSHCRSEFHLLSKWSKIFTSELSDSDNFSTFQHSVVHHTVTMETKDAHTHTLGNS